jgi:exodeoxyribonuclease-5
MSDTVAVKDLSPDQLEAYNAIMRWVGESTRRSGSGGLIALPRQPLLTLAGFAGSGKSTVVSLVAEKIELPAFCAYTGKAASVLRRKLHLAGTQTVGTQKKSREGVVSSDPRPYCGTIHSLIYRPCDCREPKEVVTLKPCPTCGSETQREWDATDEIYAKCRGLGGHKLSRKVFDALEKKTTLVYPPKHEDGRCKLCGGKEWLRREALDRDYSLICLDEASMCDSATLRDLQSYGVPILAVGDHGQLPPVGGTGELMKNPHLRLEKIHRQAEGNPIIALSKIIRETGRIPDDMTSSDAVRFEKLRFVERIIEERYESASPARLLEMGIACYTNRRRVGLNSTVRRVRGISRDGRDLPKAGEHLVCLRNIKEQGGRMPVANGMRGVLQGDVSWKIVRDTHGKLKNDRGEPASESKTQLLGSIAFPEDGIAASAFEMFGPQFQREKTYSSPEELSRETGINTFSMAGNLFDFGYAMTVHKMQGSAADDLVVCVERPGPVGEEDWRRWLYTAVTRAASKLTVLR